MALQMLCGLDGGKGTKEFSSAEHQCGQPLGISATAQMKGSRCNVISSMRESSAYGGGEVNFLECR